ncbi:YkgJ family cysteine cluster protein [Oleiharenicola lentus]|uniref:YkgJ family cysteine cluster protein n=1 Tax=Oleiharenicola lentus TaxID=2508720 RepID=UPI003F672986
MSAGFSISEEALFNKTGEGVLRRLRKTRNPMELLNVLRSARKEFDRAYDEAPAESRAAVACRAGCGACCHVLVGVQAHEVLIAAEFIQKYFSPEDLEGVIARTKEHRDAFAGRWALERAALKLPCALLKEGSCSIYEARPEACRSHHSNNADTCRSNLDLASGALHVTIPGLHGRMFAVMLGTDQAIAEAGFDGRAYDFNSALHEALTDSQCAIRWMQRQAAFPDSCREVPDAADGEYGEMVAEGYFQ